MKRIEEMTLWERSYFPEVFRGLMVTGYRFWRNLMIHMLHQLGLARDVQAAITVQYPDERAPYPDTYRGRHRLTLKPDGSVQCTACFLCATACPAACIYIQAGEYPDNTVEKFPIRLTQLAHGLPVGGELDYLDEGTLAQALRARRPVS